MMFQLYVFTRRENTVRLIKGMARFRPFHTVVVSTQRFIGAVSLHLLSKGIISITLALHRGICIK